VIGPLEMLTIPVGRDNTGWMYAGELNQRLASANRH
jgi:hypothetical protein